MEHASKKRMNHCILDTTCSSSSPSLPVPPKLTEEMNTTQEQGQEQEQKQPYLFHLIQNRRWRKIRRCLKSTKADHLCKERDESNLTCLAQALGHEAPLDIIEKMVEIDSNMATKCDKYGATALHVGCLNGAPLESTLFILNNYKDLARELDSDQRSALHHAVEFACEWCIDNDYDDWNDSTEMDIGIIQDQTCIEILRLLCDAAPEMVYSHDSSDDTPLDIVQLMRLNLDPSELRENHQLESIYKVLRDTGIRVYKKRKREWEMLNE